MIILIPLLYDNKNSILESVLLFKKVLDVVTPAKKVLLNFAVKYWKWCTMNKKNIS